MRLPPALRASLVGMCVLLLGLGASCTSATEQASPFATEQVRPPPTETSLTDHTSLIRALKSAGLAVRLDGRPGLPVSLLDVPGQAIRVDGKRASIFEYPTERALERVRSSIRPRGDQLPTADGDLAIINWGDAPHFYGSGKLLVLYFGDEQRVLDQLDLLLGPAFAGG